MRLILWAAVATLLVLVFFGDNVRRYVGLGAQDVPAAMKDHRPADSSKRGSADSIPDRPQAEKPSSGGAHVSSPAEDPNIHNSPTRRLGF